MQKMSRAGRSQNAISAEKFGEMRCWQDDGQRQCLMPTMMADDMSLARHLLLAAIVYFSRPTSTLCLLISFLPLTAIAKRL